MKRIDTHGAFVFLAGARAYKLKRAVKYPYLDFSTVERRGRVCREEVALNRRTAPDLYLGARPIVRGRDGALAFGEMDEAKQQGETVDWVVVMKRFDDDQLLDRLAQRGELTVETCEKLAEAIARFHEGAAVRSNTATDALAQVVADNIAELRDDAPLFDAAVIDEIEALSMEALSRHSDLLAARLHDGKVRHCHGDLHLRNIVLIDGVPVLFDALEFDPALATTDVLYDLAFLLMDLDHRDLRPHANRVFNRYLEVTADYDGLALMPLFLSARAAIRAKVTAAMAETGSAHKRDRRHQEARAYLAMACGYLKPPPARLVAIGGISGTGKTTVARAIAPRFGAAPGAVILRSDVIRKRMFGVREDAPLPREAYSDETGERVYRQIYEHASQALAAGHGVIADAVFLREKERELIARVAADAATAFQGIWLEAPQNALVQRVTARRGDASDADATVVARQLTLDPGKIEWRRVDAGGGPQQTAHLVTAALEPA